ncbi:snRNA-activating protein complex subunit 1-like isoform X1 [Haliotis rufescens]|uniref:snRNA-activating protein complex subunit 1-like isoform X1 n=1 Tax=Haliotis rufescens TaxID=6454 RepID=UPI00201EFC93|nr:snRNA-activating protein complex subunit 1-like isoform X1 [Haliotis rufescens]
MNFRDAYNPTRGVKEDFSKLLETFSTRKTVRYEDFAELWRSMKFSYLYAGRKNDRECREFYEEINHIALSFHLLPYDFQVRAGGLYILYGLYFTQPCVPKIPIRVTHKAWKQIMDFQQSVHSQKHYDVEYVFQKLFMQHAFLFVATPREVYIKSKDKTQTDKVVDSDSLTKDSLNMEDSVSTVFTPDILQQLRAIHMQYQQIKLGIAGPNALRPDRSLDVVEDEIMHSIDNRLVQHKQRLEKIRSSQRGRQWKAKREEHNSDDGESSDTEDPDYTPVPKSGQARVKAQAYAQQARQSKARRHRNVITLDACAATPDKSLRKTKYKSKKVDEEKEEESQLTSPTEESSEPLPSPVEYLSMPTIDMEVTHTSGTRSDLQGPTTESDHSTSKDGQSKSGPPTFENGPSTSKTSPSKSSTSFLDAETDSSKAGTTSSKVSKSSKKAKTSRTKSVLSESPDAKSPGKAKATPKAKSGRLKGKGAQQKEQEKKKRRRQSGAEAGADGAPALKVEKSSPSKTTPSKTTTCPKKNSVPPKLVYKPV